MEFSVKTNTDKKYFNLTINTKTLTDTCAQIQYQHTKYKGEKLQNNNYMTL